MTCELVLPWPPSINHYWRHARGRHYISNEGEAYRSGVKRRFQGDRFGEARVSVEIIAHPPDRRRRDLDNVLKALLDSLAHAGVYADDSQIDRLSVRRSEMVPGGMVVVCVESLP